MDSVAASADCTSSIGEGNIIKLTNKIIVGLNIAAMSEVLGYWPPRPELSRSRSIR